MSDNILQLPQLRDYTDQERIMYALENNHKLDIFTALLDFGVVDLAKVIEELLQKKVRIVFKEKNVGTNYAGMVKVEEYYLKR